MQSNPHALPRIGATVHLNTTFDWERERFRILNQERTKIAPNVLLRNMCHDAPGIAMLRTLCADDKFVLKDRVAWGQNMLRTEIFTALNLVRVANQIHRRFTGIVGGTLRDIPTAVAKWMNDPGKISVRENIKYYFDLVDECWGVRRIVYVRSASYMRSSFLNTLAQLLASHEDFWKGPKMVIPRDLRGKIAKFAVNDPEIVRLSATSGRAQAILYQLMLEHVNSGKRTKRLTPTPGMQTTDGDSADQPISNPQSEIPIPQ